MAELHSISSSSTPVVLDTPETSIIDQISGVASGLANQMTNWAQGVFAQTSQVTNQAVGNFFQTSQNMLGLSGKLTDQYNNIFAPQNKSLADEANSYNSPQRQAVNMGMAGATQAQAGEHALENAEAGLRSYGIDPSSGRYAALDKAAAVQNAANVAGAENLQRDRDTQTGMQLRKDAVQVGAQLPAAIANINNTAIQANTGASNASLANANTGRNLMSLPNDYLRTAMEVKLPPTGQNMRSSGGGSSSSPDGGSRGGGGSGGGSGGGHNPSGSGGPGWMPDHSGAGSQGIMRPGGIRPSSPSGDQTWLPPNWDQSGINSGDTTANDFTGGEGSMQVGQPGEASDPFKDYTGNTFGADLGAGGFGQTYDYGGSNQGFNGLNDMGNSDLGYGNISYDPSANSYDPGWANTYDSPSSSAFDNGGASSFQDYGAGSSSPIDTSYGAGGYDPSSYAQGGPIHDGPIPRALSPSGGQQVDDVQAQGPQGSPINLNADEFVIPRDVALWKGQEFFQNLIDQSRKKRVTAPAKPQSGQAAPGNMR